MKTYKTIPIWIGQSASIQWVKTQLKEIAETELPVLITGEFGTGKRLAALTIYALSARREQAFVEINCGAIHKLQIDNLLFKKKDGKLKQADKGVLFLNDIDFLPIEIQIKLEAILQQQRKEQIKDINLSNNVRIIAASQLNLEKMVKADQFHSKLFYRLNVANVKLPALRNHKNDIPDMVSFFANQFSMSIGREPPEIEKEAIIRLCEYNWPDNVWELKQIIEQATILSIDGRITSQLVERLLSKDYEHKLKISKSVYWEN